MSEIKSLKGNGIVITQQYYDSLMVKLTEATQLIRIVAAMTNPDLDNLIGRDILEERDEDWQMTGRLCREFLENKTDKI